MDWVGLLFERNHNIPKIQHIIRELLPRPPSDTNTLYLQHQQDEQFEELMMMDSVESLSAASLWHISTRSQEATIKNRI